MSKNVIINGTTYSGISEVLLPVSGGNALFKDEDEITVPTGSKTITTNGTHDVSAYASAVVNVPTDADPALQEKTASPSGTTEIITPDTGYDGLSRVTISPAILQEKTATPGESEQEITPDSAYYGLSKVTVGAIPDTYVQPTSTNAGGELEAGSTISAGTYFTGEATVPSGGSGETNPIISLNTEAGTVDESVWKIIANGDIIGQDADGTDVTASHDGFVFYPSMGLNYIYVFYGTEHTGPVNGEWIKVVISQFGGSKATGSFLKDNGGGVVANASLSPVTVDGRACYYVSNNLSVPAESYVGYAIPYSAIGWS